MIIFLFLYSCTPAKIEVGVDYPISAETPKDSAIYPYTYEVIADKDISDISIYDNLPSLTPDDTLTENDEFRFLSLNGDFINYGDLYSGANHIIDGNTLYSCVENKVYIITYESRIKSFFYDALDGKHDKNYIEFGDIKSNLTRNVYVKNDYVYVAHGNIFYRFNKDGTNITPIIDRSDCNSESIVFKIIGNYIYYSYNGDIIRTALDGRNSSIIITDMPRCIISDYGFFSFSENSSELIWYGFDGKIKLIYNEHDQLDNVLMCGDYLFIQASDNVSGSVGAMENAKRRNIILHIKER